MNLDDELNRELNRLFADERLSLPVAEDAERRIQSGISRRKRRRGAAAAVGGAIVAAAIVFSGALLSPERSHRAEPQPSYPTVSGSTGRSSAPSTARGSERQPTSSAPASSAGGDNGGGDNGGGGGGGGTGGGQPLPGQPGGSATPTATSTDPGRDYRRAPIGPVLGPGGFGSLSLGMSEQNALAGGSLVTPPTTSRGCTSYRVKGYSSGSTRVVAYFAKSAGLVTVDARGQAHTPEGAGTGSTAADIKRIYPGASVRGSSATAPVPGNGGASYRFDFGTTGRVTSFALTTGGCR